MLTGTPPGSPVRCCIQICETQLSTSSPTTGKLKGERGHPDLGLIGNVAQELDSGHEHRADVPSAAEPWPAAAPRDGDQPPPTHHLEVLGHRVEPRLGRTSLPTSAVYFNSLSFLPAVASLGLRRALWCVLSAKAIATLRRSCLKNCLSRRCHLRMAAL